MSQQLDEKKTAIVPLIDKMRPYNPAFGSYERSMLNLDFNYSVKLSNGRIEIAKELIDDFESNPSYISVDRLKAASSKFLPDLPIHSQPAQPQPQPQTEPVSKTNTQKTKSNKKSIWFWTGLIIIIVIGITTYIDKRSNGNGNENRLFSNPSREKSPEELRQELVSRERENPVNYLKIEGTMRNNLIGLKVLEGTITNSASIANFKDVVVEVTWFTKTDTELSKVYYTVYEYVGAGNSIRYKIKADAPGATGGFQINVSSATPAE
jgi:hypothetical protein